MQLRRNNKGVPLIPYWNKWPDRLLSVCVRVSQSVIVPQDVAFITILESQIFYLLQWYIHSISTVATQLHVCLSIEPKITHVSSVELVHYCYYDIAVPYSTEEGDMRNYTHYRTRAINYVQIIFMQCHYYSHIIALFSTFPPSNYISQQELVYFLLCKT